MAKTETNFKECWYTIYLAKKEFLHVEEEEFVPFPLSIWRSRRIMTDRFRKAVYAISSSHITRKHTFPYNIAPSVSPCKHNKNFAIYLNSIGVWGPSRPEINSALRSFFATPDTLFSFRYVGSMGSMKRLRTTKVLCADHKCWLLIIQFRLFIYLFIYWLLIYSIIYLFIHLFIICLFLCFRCFPFFFVHLWADSTEIFLTTFIRIITFQSHSRTWQVDLNTTKKILWFLCDLTSSGIRGRIRGRYFSSPFCACVTGHLDTKSFRYIQVYSV